MPSQTGFREDRVGVYIEKDPYAVLDYTLDWTNWMAAGDEISAVSITAETISGDSAPLAVDLATNTAVLATAYLSGGTAGNIYNIEYRIDTNNGLKDSRNIRIKVVERQVGL